MTEEKLKRAQDLFSKIPKIESGLNRLISVFEEAKTNGNGHSISIYLQKQGKSPEEIFIYNDGHPDTDWTIGIDAIEKLIEHHKKLLEEHKAEFEAL